MSGTVLDTQDGAVSKTDTMSYPHEAYILMESDSFQAGEWFDLNSLKLEGP